jgi:hypothetical protein
VGTGGGTSPADCARVVLERPLQSPVAAVIAGWVVGKMLDVALVETPNIQVVIVDGPASAGSVVPTTQLIGCLRSGVEFQAEVYSKVGALVSLRITAK